MKRAFIFKKAAAGPRDYSMYSQTALMELTVLLEYVDSEALDTSASEIKLLYNCVTSGVRLVNLGRST